MAQPSTIFADMNGLDMEIQFLPGVGPKRAELLRKELGVETVGDLLRFYPFRYIDKSSIVRIADARPDMAYLQMRARVLRVELFGNSSAAAAEEYGLGYNLVAGANIAGFKKVAEAMLAQGVF